jgi:hypothetical protein
VLSDDPLEERSLSYFRIRTAAQFAAHFDNGFWSQSVLQLSTREPCVRHAIVALGALHEAFDEERQVGKTLETDLQRVAKSRAFAYEYYAKAITVLNSYIHAHSWKGLDVSLLCCILCVGFEWLSGNNRAASMHLSSGLLVLRQWSEKRSSVTPGISYSSPAGHFIRGQMAPLFTRLTIQASTLDANRLPPLPWSSEIEEARLKSTEHRGAVAARSDIDVVLSGAYLQPENFASLFPNYVMKEETRAYSISKLTEWYGRYHEYIYKLGAHWDPTAIFPPDKLCLTLWHTLLTVMLNTSHTANQKVYDAFLPHFQYMVTLAKQLLDVPLSSSQDCGSSHASFKIDMETIPMLYFVGSKCRDPLVRRRALTLLRSAARREGLWDSFAHVRLLEEMVKTEEEGIENVVDENSVPVSARIYKLCEETDLEKRRMMVRFWKQGEEGFGPFHIITW